MHLKDFTSTDSSPAKTRELQLERLKANAYRTSSEIFLNFQYSLRNLGTILIIFQMLYLVDP